LRAASQHRTALRCFTTFKDIGVIRVLLVIFAIAVLGSLLCLAVGFALNFIARKSHDQTLVLGVGRAEASDDAPPRADPVLVFGFVLACYGATALALVSALPGRFALERTVLAFAVLCVGGLICEISKTRPAVPLNDVELDEPTLARRRRVSSRWSVALAVALNLAFAVLSADQGLVDIVPPKPNAGHTQELEPIVVVAQRTQDPLDDHGSLF
jgi:hypothetical protein